MNIEQIYTVALLKAHITLKAMAKLPL